MEQAIEDQQKTSVVPSFGVEVKQQLGILIHEATRKGAFQKAKLCEVKTFLKTLKKGGGAGKKLYPIRSP